MSKVESCSLSPFYGTINLERGMRKWPGVAFLSSFSSAFGSLLEWYCSHTIFSKFTKRQRALAMHFPHREDIIKQNGIVAKVLSVQKNSRLTFTRFQTFLSGKLLVKPQRHTQWESTGDWKADFWKNNGPLSQPDSFWFQEHFFSLVWERKRSLLIREKYTKELCNLM